MIKKKYNYPEYSKEYYRKNRDLIKARRAAMSEESKQKLAEKQREYQKRYREEHEKYFKEKLAEWRITHPDYSKEYHTKTYIPHKRPDYEQANLHPMYERLQRIKKRAREKDVPCTITVYDLDIPEVCPYLGIPLTGKTSKEDNTPSIDRIIPALGYIPGNVEVISTLANRMKNSATPGQLVTFAQHALKIFSAF